MEEKKNDAVKSDTKEANEIVMLQQLLSDAYGNASTEERY